jgi:hypothetical protein
MKNENGLNEEKNLNQGNDLSIEPSEVNHVVSLDSNSLSIRVKREGRKCQKKHFNS